MGSAARIIFAPVSFIPGAEGFGNQLSGTLQEATGAASARRTREELGRQREQQAQFQRDILAREREQESTQAADRSRREARRRQLALGAGRQGRGETILTAPLGEIGQGSVPGQQTLLGA